MFFHRVHRLLRRRPSPASIVGFAALGAYALFVVRLLRSRGGIPTSREIQVLLILGGFAAASITSVRRVRKLVLGVLFDWLPFAAMLALYDPRSRS